MAPPRLWLWSRPCGALRSTLLLWGAMIATSACTSTRPCRNGTLLVSVSLDATTAPADKLTVAVKIAGGTPAMTPLDHQPGQASGTVEVDFPAGYPQGQMVTVTV